MQTKPTVRYNMIAIQWASIKDSWDQVSAKTWSKDAQHCQRECKQCKCFREQFSLAKESPLLRAAVLKFLVLGPLYILNNY